jgi:hypothetical protein
MIGGVEEEVDEDGDGVAGAAVGAAPAAPWVDAPPPALAGAAGVVDGGVVAAGAGVEMETAPPVRDERYALIPVTTLCAFADAAVTVMTLLFSSAMTLAPARG